MEQINISLNDVPAFDKAVHGDGQVRCLPQASVVSIVTKDGAMASKRAGAVISFLASLDGKPVQVQATVSVRQLVTCLRVLDARYDDGLPRVGN